MPLFNGGADDVVVAGGLLLLGGIVAASGCGTRSLDPGHGGTGRLAVDGGASADGGAGAGDSASGRGDVGPGSTASCRLTSTAAATGCSTSTSSATTATPPPATAAPALPDRSDDAPAPARPGAVRDRALRQRRARRPAKDATMAMRRRATVARPTHAIEPGCRCSGDRRPLRRRLRRWSGRRARDLRRRQRGRRRRLLGHLCPRAAVPPAAATACSKGSEECDCRDRSNSDNVLRSRVLDDLQSGALTAATASRNGPEECDVGCFHEQRRITGSMDGCTSSCNVSPLLRRRDPRLSDNGEQCDLGAQNGLVGQPCAPRCKVLIDN